MRINPISFKGVRVSDELSDFMRWHYEASYNPERQYSLRVNSSKVVERFEETCAALQKFPLDIYLDKAHDNHNGISVSLEQNGDKIELRSYPYINPKPEQVVKNCIKDIERFVFSKNFKPRKMKSGLF